MKRVRCILWLLVVALGIPEAMAQVTLVKSSGRANEFSLINRKGNAQLYVDEQDFEVVKKAAGLFSDDVRKVTGKTIKTGTIKNKLASNILLVGTLGHNELIDKLVAKNKLDITALENRWESFLIEVVRNPLPGVNKALVVVGSDRRGTCLWIIHIVRSNRCFTVVLVGGCTGFKATGTELEGGKSCV
jgi:hypothetical protein